MDKNKKHWLESARYVEKEIESLRCEQSRLISKGLVSSPPSLYKYYLTQPSGNSMEWRNIEYIGYTELIEERIRDLLELKKDIHRAISAVPEPAYRILLIEHYVNGKDLLSISTILGYSYDHVVKDIHPAAVGAITVPEKYKNNDRG